MKIRRIIATAVAAAVTTPALLLSVTPAFAADQPAAQTQHQPSIAELEKAAAEAQAAYDSAVAAENAAKGALEAVLSDTNALTLAAKAAEAAATEAATAKTAADQAVADAQAALDALPDTATEEERTAAAATLTQAQAAAAAAAEAKATADAEAAAAWDARDDERVAAFRALTLAKEATEAALADKNAADEALARAKEEAGEEDGDEECVPEPKLTTVATGLPSTVVAGTKVAFTLRVTNGTDKAMDEVLPFAYVHATDESGLKDIDALVHLQWASAGSPQWKTVDNEHYMDAVSPLKAGAHADFKMRLAVDASAPAGDGITFFAGDYFNDNGTCGGTPDLEGYEFSIAAAGSKPGKVEDAKPGTTEPRTSDVKPQGGTSAPVGGTLAATGASPATEQLALASAAAVALGAGAVFAARRRKAAAQA